MVLDLSHPLLHQFYVQQRLFFRQIYVQQLAALSARFGLVRDQRSMIIIEKSTIIDHSADQRSFPTSHFSHFYLIPIKVPSSVEDSVFDPSVPHQHLGFPPAPPPMGQLLVNGWCPEEGEEKQQVGKARHE